MTYSRFCALAAVFTIVACTDNPTTAPNGTDVGPQPLTPGASLVAISGRIIVTGSGPDRAVDLRDGGGNTFRLVGKEAAALASVDGGDVLVRGTADGNPGIVVQEFQVIGMKGRPALDGVLVETIDGYALRLADGSLRVIAGMPEDCAEHIGARLWVIGWEDASPEFGLIAAQ
jgi:hypothetical protein